MIGIDRLRRKAAAPWENGTFLRAFLNGQSLFPLAIRFGKPSGRRLSTEFAAVRQWITELRAASKEMTGHGFRIDYEEIRHRRLGPQKLPFQIVFDTEADWLQSIGKEADLARFARLAGETRRREPRLLPFLEEKPLAALAHAGDWPALLSICAWFRDRPQPGLYLRQLDIPGVDTKFIETRKSLLTELLDRVLDDAAIDRTVTGPARHGFERRFGVKYDPPLIRLRLLAPDLAIHGFTDLTLPVADAAAADFRVDTVFVTENKVNGLSFPDMPNALIIFGLGYGLEQLAEIPWLKEKRLCYWGDIDTHGFAMLSRFRGCFPHARSLLMDRETLLRHHPLWVEEPEAKRFLGNLANLSEEEEKLFTDLKEDRLGERVRLEQERIGFGWVNGVLGEM